MSDLKDPRVLFAAERTLLAWARTSLTLMAFGFGIERFGLFVKMMGASALHNTPGRVSFFVGLAFIAAGAVTAAAAVVQYKRFVRTLNSQEIPPRYSVHLVSWTCGAIALLGGLLAFYVVFDAS